METTPAFEEKSFRIVEASGKRTQTHSGTSEKTWI